LLERLTAEHGAREYEPELALAYHNRTAAMLKLASHERNAARVRQALASNGEALAILRRLVLMEGRSDLVDRLVQEYHVKALILDVVTPPHSVIPQDPPSPDDPGVEAKNHAHILEAAGDFGGAATLFGEAVEMYRPAVDKDRVAGPLGQLAVTLINRAPNLVLAGRIDDGARDCEEARELLDAFAARFGVREITAYLARLDEIERLIGEWRKEKER
jgi:tetratricopeptide (TPR) repeat protein